MKAVLLLCRVFTGRTSTRTAVRCIILASTGDRWMFRGVSNANSQVSFGVVLTSNVSAVASYFGPSLIPWPCWGSLSVRTFVSLGASNSYDVEVCNIDRECVSPRLTSAKSYILNVYSDIDADKFKKKWSCEEERGPRCEKSNIGVNPILYIPKQEIQDLGSEHRVRYASWPVLPVQNESKWGVMYIWKSHLEISAIRAIL